MSRPVLRGLRLLRTAALVAAVVLFAAGATQGAAVTPETMPPAPDADFWRWAVTQGGLLVGALVLGWSYRRDLLRLHAQARAENAQLLATLQTTTAAMAAYAETMRQQSTHLAEMARVVEHCRAVQHLLEGAHE